MFDIVRIRRSYDGPNCFTSTVYISSSPKFGLHKNQTMTASSLDKLETQLRKQVAANDIIGVRETIVGLCTELQIPSYSVPALVARDEATHAVIDRCAELVCLVTPPGTESLCAELIICAASQLVTGGNPDRLSKSVR